MKKNLFTVFLVVCFLMIHSDAFAKKFYTIGDTLRIDGIWGYVFNIDESGEHGKVMCAPINKKKLEKALKKSNKAIEKLDIPQEQKDSLIRLNTKSMYIIPPIEYTEQKKGRRAYNLIDFEKALPAGWRLMNENDVADINEILHSGTNGSIMRSKPASVLFGFVSMGLIGRKVEDEGNSPAFFFRYKEPFSINRYTLRIADGYLETARTVAVKEF